jgi:hypothetical protein
VSKCKKNDKKKKKSSSKKKKKCFCFPSLVLRLRAPAAFVFRLSVACHGGRGRAPPDTRTRAVRSLFFLSFFVLMKKKKSKNIFVFLTRRRPLSQQACRAS